MLDKSIISLYEKITKDRQRLREKTIVFLGGRYIDMPVALCDDENYLRWFYKRRHEPTEKVKMDVQPGFFKAIENRLNEISKHRYFIPSSGFEASFFWNNISRLYDRAISQQYTQKTVKEQLMMMEVVLRGVIIFFQMYPNKFQYDKYHNVLCEVIKRERMLHNWNQYSEIDLDDRPDDPINSLLIASSDTEANRQTAIGLWMSTIKEDSLDEDFGRCRGRISRVERIRLYNRYYYLAYFHGIYDANYPNGYRCTLLFREKVYTGDYCLYSDNLCTVDGVRLQKICGFGHEDYMDEKWQKHIHLFSAGVIKETRVVDQSTHGQYTADVLCENGKHTMCVRVTISDEFAYLKAGQAVVASIDSLKVSTTGNNHGYVYFDTLPMSGDYYYSHGKR